MLNLFARVARILLYRIIGGRKNTAWALLRFYPHIIPSDEILRLWTRSEWPEYQRWIDTHCVGTVQQWKNLHKQALAWKKYPRISIITPVYNTAPEMLKTCILSVRLQTSPFWELILVDDGSSSEATRQILTSAMCRDPRIHVLSSIHARATGISAASNRGIDHAAGEFILFLDHDDRLAPDALQAVSEDLMLHPDTDIVYSDRDMISLENKRYMHLMKPDWSPETLYSCNYIFHLICYRKELIEKVGKLRSEFDGGQDHDLILRCMEQTEKIRHLPKVLYHYREHTDSIATNEDAKSYAYTAGIHALDEALQRRNIAKIQIKENPDLWRGNYQIQLAETSGNKVTIIRIDNKSTAVGYAQHLNGVMKRRQVRDSPLLLLHQEYVEESSRPIETLASWLALPKIGMVSGCVITNTGKIVYAGITFDQKSGITLPYLGYSKDEPGYMGVNKNLRNISGPDPYAVMIRYDVWKNLGGVDTGYKGPHALLDLALRALQSGYRILYVPMVIYKYSGKPLFKECPEEDIIRFRDTWRHWFRQGDPYYPANMSRKSICYELCR